MNKMVKKWYDICLEAEVAEDEVLEDEEAKKDFPKKIIEPKLFLNKFGTYILQIDFKDKNNYLNRLKQKRKIKSQKPKAKKHHRVKNVQEIYGTRTYGQYKQTGTYRPI